MTQLEKDTKKIIIIINEGKPKWHPFEEKGEFFFEEGLRFIEPPSVGLTNFN